MNFASNSQIWENPSVLFGAMMVLPMILIAAVPRRWRVRAILGWFLLPLVAYFGAFVWEAIRVPAETGHNMQLALLGLALLSPALMIVWGVPSVIGVLLGLALGRFTRPAKSAAVPRLVRLAPIASLHDLAGARNWPMIHVGPLSDRLVIGGFEVRCFKWWPCEPKNLHFTNPKSSLPLICDVYEIGTPTGRTHFAAGEVSNGVWAFFSAAPHTLIRDQTDTAPVGGWPQPAPDQFDPPPGGPPVQRVSPDGSIRVDIQSMEWTNTHWVNTPRVTNIGKDKVILDLWGSDCHAVTSFPRERCVVLGVQRYRGGQTFKLTLDVGRQVYELAAGPGLNIPSQTGRFDDLAALAARLVAWDTPGAAPKAQVRVARRSGLLILGGALLAICAIGYYNYMTDVGSHIIVTPMPKLPEGQI